MFYQITAAARGVLKPISTSDTAQQVGSGHASLKQEVSNTLQTSATNSTWCKIERSKTLNSILTVFTYVAFKKKKYLVLLFLSQ